MFFYFIVELMSQNVICIINCLIYYFCKYRFIDDKCRHKEEERRLHFSHIVAYEISSKSSLHPRSFFFYLRLFSYCPFLSFSRSTFFFLLTDYTVVGAAVSRDSQDTKRWNEQEDRNDEERTECTDVRRPPVRDREIDLSNYVKQSPG